MRIALWCVLLGGIPAALVAQDSTATFEEPTPLAVSGFAVGTWTADRNAKDNTFAGSKLAVSLFRPWSDQLYFFGQLTATLLPPADSSSQPGTEVEIDNLIVNWTPSGASQLTLRFGRWDAPVGFERDDEPLNLIPTNSFNFDLARPSKFTGVIGRYVFTPKWNVAAYVVNGWNVGLDNNSGKTGGARVEFIPTEGLSLGVNGVYGPERDHDNASRRSLLSGDLTLDAGAFILGAEANFGRETGDGGGPVAVWDGVAATGFLRLGWTYGLSVRGETLRDRDGLLTGTPQTLASLTISPWYFYRSAQQGIFTAVDRTSFRIPAFSLRPAIRYDHSTVATFPAAGGGFKRDNVTGILELVYVF